MFLFLEQNFINGEFILCIETALKNSYVDVFNPSGAAPKNSTPILAPTMPTMPAQQMNFFVPSPNSQQNVSKMNNNKTMNFK